MNIVASHFVAGRRSAEGDTSFRAVAAAAAREMEPTFRDATAAEVEAACDSAAEATAAFRAAPLETRARLLDQIADGLEARVEAFVERATQETGLPEARIRTETVRTANQMRLFAGVVRAGDFLGVRIDRADPERKPMPKPDVRQYRVPLGPVAVFGASNFPLAFSVAGGDTASALAAGCPVVVKGHPAHPGTSALAAEAVEAAVRSLDLPGGVFSMLHGKANAVGAALVTHPAIRAVGFTGSFRGGSALAKLAAERPQPIPVFAEMGSVNPVFLLQGALERRAEEIADGLLASLTMGCGQFCTNPGLILASKGAGLDRFLARLAEGARDLEAGVMLHAGILSAYESSRERLERSRGVATVAHGQAAPERAQAVVYRTALDRFLADRSLGEEVFGPCTLVVEAPDEAALAQAAAALDGQLTVTLHAEPEELETYAALLAKLEDRAGRLLFGGWPTGVEVCHAMTHGGPWPATSDSRSTSVGSLAIERWLRPVSYQGFPEAALPEPLRDANPLGLRRLIDGNWT